MPNGFAHAWFSQQQAERAGSNIYLHENGQEVETSMIDEVNEEQLPPNFDDVVYLGRVTKWIRAGNWKASTEGETRVFMEFMRKKDEL